MQIDLFWTIFLVFAPMVKKNTRRQLHPIEQREFLLVPSLRSVERGL